MKRRILVLILAITIAVIPGFTVCAMDYSLAGGDFTSTATNWGPYEYKGFTKLHDVNRKSMMEEVFDVDNNYVYGEMRYIKYGPSCNNLVREFTDLDGAKVFYKGYGKAVLDQLMFQRGNEDSDEYDVKISKVINGKTGDFVKADITQKDQGSNAECVYICNIRSNIYCLFYEERLFENIEEELSLEEKEKYIEEADQQFEEIVESYADTGYLDKFLKKAEKRTVIEKIGGADVLLSNIKIYVLIAVVIVIPLVIFLILFIKMMRNGNVPLYTKGRGDKKKTTKTVDGKVTTTVHCTYEDSLRSLKDSGLLTQKEYREMLDKHGR